MANFNTHFAAAAVVSGIAATLCLRIEEFSSNDVLICFAAGILGGILPDADSDNSTAIRIVFNAIALLLCAGFVIGCSRQYPVTDALLVTAAIFITVRFGAAWLFAKLTVHRGVFHSLTAVALSSLLAIWLAHHQFAYDALHSWAIGAFLGGGYLLHLVLDECYSVDLMNNKIKRSFGTALKIAGNARSTVLALAALALLSISAPTPAPFHTVLRNNVPSWTQLQAAATIKLAHLKRLVDVN
jgi:hypothetical protein